MSQPKRLFRVEYLAGFGWPRCERREETHRNFESALTAARQVQTIQRLPSHHRLLGVYVGDVVWKQIDVDQLPEVA